MPKTARTAISIAALAFMAAACATPTVYQPVSKQGASGFTENQIETNRFRITFRGGSDANAARVKDLALLRAADLTLANGYSWFEVVNSYAETQDSNGPTIGVGGGTGSYGHSGGIDIGIGTSFKLTGPIRTQTIEIVMGKDAKPERPSTYDAQSIKKSIDPVAK